MAYLKSFGLAERMVLLIGAALTLASCAGEREVGDGRLRDDGLGAYYPRRRIELPVIFIVSLRQEREFRLMRIPKARYTLWLIPTVGTGDPRAAWPVASTVVRELGIEARVSVEAQRKQGARRFEAEGRLERICDCFVPPDRFTEGGYGQDRAFVAGVFENMLLDGEARIHVTITAAKLPEPSQLIGLQIVLVGGGFKI